MGFVLLTFRQKYDTLLPMINTLLTITGPSLSGKSTMENMLVQKYALEKIVSFTTRPIRAGEIDGEHYYFLKRTLAEQKIVDGEMAEHVEFSGNLYGILGSELQSKLQKNSCIAVVEPRGLKQMARYCRENDIFHKAIFLTNSPQLLAARFLQRFRADITALPSDYANRLVGMITDEQAWIHEYDYNMIYPSFNPFNEDRVVQEVYDNLTTKQK